MKQCVCRRCATTFLRRRSEIVRNRKRRHFKTFCSRRCSLAATRIRRIAKSSSIVAAMEAAYRSGDTLAKVGTMFGITKQAIRSRFNIRAIEIRSMSEAKSGDIDHSAFECAAQSEEAAYWIGFLMADGCVADTGRQRPRLCVTLHEKDELHLLRLRRFLGSSNEIYHSTKALKGGGITRHSRLSVTSEKIAECLASYGVTPRKTHTAKISGLENNRHFWRGVIDGDGCMSVSVRGNHHRLMLSLTGSHPLLEQFRAFVRSVISDCNATVRPSRSVYCYTIGCRQARLMVRALYEGCKIALDRKLAIAERVMAHGF